MLVVGSVEVTAVPDEAVDGVGSTAGAASVTTDEVTAVPDEAVDGVGSTAGAASVTTDEVTAVPDEAVDGVGSTAGAASVTTDGCAVVSESFPQATKAANARTMTTARTNCFFTSASFDEDFHLFQ